MNGRLVTAIRQLSAKTMDSLQPPPHGTAPVYRNSRSQLTSLVRILARVAAKEYVDSQSQEADSTPPIEVQEMTDKAGPLR